MMSREPIPSTEAKDRGSLALVRFLQNLSEVLTVDEVIPGETRKLPYQAQVRGKLKSSGAGLTLGLFFGHTDRLSEAPVQSNEEMIRSLETSDLIVYKGHSGLGENFKLTRLLEESRSPPEPKALSLKPSHQVVAFVGCHTFSYFGEDIVNARRKQKLDTTLITTIAGGTNSNAALDVLAWIDSNHHQKKQSVQTPEDSWRDFDVRNHLVIQQIR
jgi:hypothetical protein